jgi:hypothetical protein
MLPQTKNAPVRDEPGHWIYKGLALDSSLWCYYQGQEKNPASPQLS